MALTNWQKTFLSSIRTARAAIPEGCAFKEEAELIFAQLTIGVTAPSMPAAERRNRTAAPAKPAAAAKVPQPARARGRPRSSTAATAAAATPFGEQVYGLIPAMGGGIQQTSIKIAGVKPNNIGMALSRLQKAGRLVSQGAGKTKTWFRSGVQEQVVLRRASVPDPSAGQRAA